MVSVTERLAVEDLYSRYSNAVDGGRFDDWVELFTPDGAFVSREEHVGREALGVFVRARAARIAGERLRDEQHWTSNLLISREGSQLHATCNFARIAIDKVSGRPEVAALGRYEDVIVEHGGALRFLRRRAVIL